MFRCVSIGDQSVFEPTMAPDDISIILKEVLKQNNLVLKVNLEIIDLLTCPSSIGLSSKESSGGPEDAR